MKSFLAKSKNQSNGVRRQCTEQGWLETYGVKDVKDAGRYLYLSPNHDGRSSWTERAGSGIIWNTGKTDCILPVTLDIGCEEEGGLDGFNLSGLGLSPCHLWKEEDQGRTEQLWQRNPKGCLEFSLDTQVAAGRGLREWPGHIFCGCHRYVASADKSQGLSVCSLSWNQVLLTT